MAMFRFMWLRRLVRRHTTPIPYRKANQWKQRLSIIYAIISWNALGFIFYEFYGEKGKKKLAGIQDDEFDMLSPSQQFAIRSGIEKAKIVKMKNFETTDFNLEEFKHLKKDPASIEEMRNKPVDDDDDDDNVA